MIKIDYILYTYERSRETMSLRDARWFKMIRDEQHHHSMLAVFWGRYPPELSDLVTDGRALSGAYIANDVSPVSVPGPKETLGDSWSIRLIHRLTDCKWYDPSRVQPGTSLCMSYIINIHNIADHTVYVTLHGRKTIIWVHSQNPGMRWFTQSKWQCMLIPIAFQTFI